ncbi:MAG: ABC transporter ATP-binding protein [Pseudomonadota bacterium]
MTKKVVAQVCDLVKELGEGAGKVQAVKKTNLSINSGELTLLMGPSGSGKTTLISILGCILTPTSGEVIIDGENTTGMSAEKLADIRRRHIGFIFQSYNLFPTLNAIENVRLALDVRGSRGALSRDLAEKALVAVGLSHRMKSYPKQMSGGEQQRVAIARALAGSPSVILADEPTAALDSENGHSVMALLAEVAHNAGRAVLAVTHDPRTLSYADRILRIEDGHIIDDERGDAASRSTQQLIPKKRRTKLDA